MMGVFAFADHDPAAPGLARGFLESVRSYGDRPALEAGDETLTYKALYEKAASLAATLVRHQPEAGGPPLTAVFASRSTTAFAGILAALLRGHGYVPLNRAFPTVRTQTMLLRSGCRAVVVDSASEEQLDAILGGIGEGLLIILPERREAGDLASRWPKHRFVGAAGLAAPDEWTPAFVSPGPIAYLLFTSGSTGTPKGVMVGPRSVRNYVEFVADYLNVSPEDRFSQTFDLTFDLSASDLFVAWERGACVCCPSETTLVNPGRFIKKAGLTVWFSVPSVAVFLKRLGVLKPGAFPRLRASLFCGEALPVEIAASWAAAAPNSVVENFYGPTELTIACAHYRWNTETTPAESVGGIVPIGRPFPGMRPLVVDEELREVEPGRDGELLMSGAQVALGYWNDQAQTAAAFVKPPARDEVFYRTGDRIRRPVGNGPMIFLGRNDNQIKVLGHRVELSEIEAVVREESGVDGVVALGWPRMDAGAGGVEVFLQAETAACPDLVKKVARRLPLYMVPRRIHYLASFPLNANGKFDRNALIRRLEGMP